MTGERGPLDPDVVTLIAHQVQLELRDKHRGRSGRHQPYRGAVIALLREWGDDVAEEGVYIVVRGQLAPVRRAESTEDLGVDRMAREARVAVLVQAVGEHILKTTKAQDLIRTVVGEFVLSGRRPTDEEIDRLVAEAMR